MNKRTRTHKLISSVFILSVFILSLAVFLPVFPVNAHATIIDDDDNGGGNGLVKGQFSVVAGSRYNSARESFHLTVTADNYGPDITATVRFICSDTADGPSFEKVVAFPAGSEKNVDFFIPGFVVEAASNSGSDVLIQILDGKKVIDETRMQFTSVFSAGIDRGIEIALLSDTPNKLTWLDNSGNTVYIDGETQMLHTEKLEPDFVPDDLAFFEYLVIDNFDTKVLSPDQIDAIVDWVSAGGALIIGTGGNYDALSGLPEDFTDLKLKDTGEGGIYYAADYGVSYFSPTGDNYYHLRQYVNGAIQVVDFSLTGELIDPAGNLSDIADAMVEYDNQYPLADREYVIYKLFSEMSQYCNVNSSVSSYNYSYNIKECFEYIEEKKNLEFGFVKFLVILYIALSGPVLYLVLKKLGKREMIWGAIPALAVVFVGLIYLAGAGQRITGLCANSVTVSSADGSGNSHCYISGYNSSNRDYSFDLVDGFYTAAEYSENAYYYSGQAQRVRLDDEGIRVTTRPGQSFAQFMTLALSQNRENGGLFVQINNPGVMDGTVTNNTGHDLPLVVVADEDDGVLLENIKAGETVELTDSSHIRESFMYTGPDSIRDLMSSAYYNKDYEVSSMIAAMAIASMDIIEEHRLGRIVCIGVEAEQTPVLKDKKPGRNYTCLYSETEQAYYTATGG